MTSHQQRLAFEELLSHRILAPDFLVQRTVFSSDVEVTVNFGQFLFMLEDGSDLPAHGYRVTDKSPQGRSFSGEVDTRIASSAKA